MTDNNPIMENKAQLIEVISVGAKPDPKDWRIGSEHEKFIFHRSDNAPLAYDGDGRPGIKCVLEQFAKHGWNPVLERARLIATEQHGASLTLEPGGQFELSGAPLNSIHETCDEVTRHLNQAKDIGKELDIGFIGLGFHPTLKREDVPIMPKARYDIMRAYMPKKGNLGLDMMLRTCTVQVNLDFSSEADMVKKFRIGLALQPIATALFANSPFYEGKPNGFQSYRSHIWTDTDPDRTGMLPWVFEEGMGYERYVDYALDVPMYFIKRGDGYIDCSGLSFRDFMKGELPALMGEKPTLVDWQDHMTTIFPEVRLKSYLEMRGADGGPWSKLCAFPALWVGLLYDTKAQDAAWDMVKDWSIEEMQAMRDQVPRLGIGAEHRGKSLQEIAKTVIEIADGGLKRRACLSTAGDNEQGFLNPLWDTVENGKSPADRMLEKYNGVWDGDINRVFADYSY